MRVRFPTKITVVDNDDNNDNNNDAFTANNGRAIINKNVETPRVAKGERPVVRGGGRLGESLLTIVSTGRERRHVRATFRRT